MSKNRLQAFFLIFIFFLLQNTLNYLFPGKCPSLLLAVVIFYSLREGALFGMVLGAVAGFLLEMFGQGRIGFWIMNLAAVGALSGYASSKVFQDSLLTEILLPGIAFYFSSLAEIIYLQLCAGTFSGWEALGRAFLFWPLLGTFVFSPVLFAWLQGASSGRQRTRR